MLAHLFSNYESEKLIISHPEICNLIIWIALILFSLLSAHKTTKAKLLCKSQSEQLRGLAILMVMVGHLWVHVSQMRVTLVMGSDAVALFLLLSGFGLTRSVMSRPITLKKYIISRIRRIMIPYWLATLFILILDFIILERRYAFIDILLTISGINFLAITKNIDYVRWYITFILFWYILFYLAIDKIHQTVRTCFLICCGVFVFFIGYYIIHVGWNQIFAFPIGCIIGKYYTSLQLFLSEKSKKTLIGVAILIVGGALIFKYRLLPTIEGDFPSIVNKGLREVASLSLGAGLILTVYVWNKMGYISCFLCFIGLISYELFLLHGALLIKYNPIFRLNYLLPMPATFLIYLALMILLSLGFRKLTKPLGA